MHSVRKHVSFSVQKSWLPVHFFPSIGAKEEHWYRESQDKAAEVLKYCLIFENLASEVSMIGMYVVTYL